MPNIIVWFFAGGGAAAAEGDPNIIVLRAFAGAWGAGEEAAAFEAGVPNIIVWFCLTAGVGGGVLSEGGGLTEALPNINVLLPGADAAARGGGTGAGSLDVRRAVKTCPHRVH